MKGLELTVLPLGIQDIVQRDQVLVLVHSTGTHSSQLLHVRTHAKQKSQVHTECSDVSTGLAADPEDTEVTVVVELDELRLVDGPDTELTLDGRNQGGSLEQGTSEELEDASKLCPAARDLVVEAHNGDILLSGSLLGLDETCGTVDADNETSGDLGIESTTVAGLLCSEHALHPSDDFVGGGIGGLIELWGKSISVRWKDYKKSAKSRSHVDDTGRDCYELATVPLRLWEWWRGRIIP